MIMVPPDSLLYEYAVVRYVPRVEREEFINIGLLMMCKRQGWMKGRIVADEKRLSVFSGHREIKNLRHQCAMFENISLPDAGLPVEERYRWLTAVKSSVLQISPSHPGLITVNDKLSQQRAIDLLEKEFDRLLETLVL